MFKLLKKNKNFSLVFIGYFISKMGNTIYNFAIAWFLYSNGVKASIVSLYLAVGLLTSLILSPFAGVIADRISKVKIMYITDFIRGVVVLLGGYLFINIGDIQSSIYILFIMTALLSINASLFNPAVTTLLPELIDRNDVKKANSLLSIVNSFQTIFGVLLGATLYELLGVELIFIINGISFIISGLSEMFIRNVNCIKRDSKVTFVSDFKVGIKYLVSDKGIIALLIGIIMLNFAMVPLFSNGFPYLFSQVLKTNSFQISIVNVCAALGMIVGGVIVGNAAKSNVKKSTIIGIVLQGFLFVLIGIIMILVSNNQLPYIWFFIPFLVFVFSLSFANIFVHIPLNTSFLLSLDKDKRGRIMGFVTLLTNIATPLALIIGGLLIDFGGINYLVYFSVILSVLVILMFTRNNAVNRKLTDLSENALSSN